MKRFLWGLFVCISSAASAQRIQFGLEGGLQGANQLYKASDPGYGTAKTTGDLRLGVRAGGLLDAPFNRNFSLQTGLYFSQKGLTDPSSSSVRLRINYLELPVSLMAKGRIGKGQLFLGAGPFIAVALDGKIGDGTVDQDLTFGSNGQLQSLDAGMQVSAGYQARKGLFVRSYASRSVTDIANNRMSTINVAIYNITYGLSLGYFF